MFPDQTRATGWGAASDPCFTDIRCYSTHWAYWEGSAVALILLENGEELGSGALVTNTAEDNRPYFLTAFHNADTNKDQDLSTSEINAAKNWGFRFNYQRACGYNWLYDDYYMYNGAQFKAGWWGTDFLLMELNLMPLSPDRIITLLGWDRRNINPSASTIVHHPLGDVMKISEGTALVPNSTSYLMGAYPKKAPVNSHWEGRITTGAVEKGSSGGPVLNQDRKVIGQLHSASKGCKLGDFTAGRFYESWTGGNTTDSQLSHWLDPLGNNTIMTTNHLKVYIPPPTIITGPSNFCLGSSASYTVTNAPNGFTWDKSSNIIISGSGTTVTVTGASGGSGWISIKSGGVDVAKVYVEIYTTPIYRNIQGDVYFYTPDWGDYSVYLYPGETVLWSITPTTNIQLTPTNKSYTYVIPLVAYYSTDFDLKATISRCGGSIDTYLHIGIFQGWSPSPPAYPNPASSTLNVEIDAAAIAQARSMQPAITNGQPLNIASTYDIRLYDGQGNLLRQANTKGGTVQFDVSNLPDGIYYLHIYDGVNSRPEMQQIMVEH